MKVKKFAALFLAVVMAITMLTACGGGGAGSMSLSEVNSLLSDMGSSARVVSDSELTSAVKTVAASLKESGVYTSEAAQAKIQELIATNDGSNVLRSAGAAVVSDTELKAGTNLGSLGFVNSPEGLVAASVRVLELAAQQSFKNPAGAKYAASATTIQADNGTLYWVIGVELIINIEDVI